MYKVRGRRRHSPPLALASDFELLPIGTRVHFTHRAGIARYKKLYDDGEETSKSSAHASSSGLDLSQVEPSVRAPIGWKIIDGLYPMEDFPGPPEEFFGKPLREHFLNWPRARFGYEKANKTVMIWPENSYGWIIGKVRKGIGASHKSHYYHGGYYAEPDYDPGYFAIDMYVDLYVVKQMYDGTSYIYCPMWAVNKVEDDG